MEDKINLLLTLFASSRTPATRALSLIRRRVELKARLLSVRKSVMALNYNSKSILQQEAILIPADDDTLPPPACTGPRNYYRR